MLIRLSRVEKFIYIQSFSDNTDVQTNLGIITIKQGSINFSKRSDSKLLGYAGQESELSKLYRHLRNKFVLQQNSTNLYWQNWKYKNNRIQLFVIFGLLKRITKFFLARGKISVNWGSKLAFPIIRSTANCHL